MTALFKSYPIGRGLQRLVARERRRRRDRISGFRPRPVHHRPGARAERRLRDAVNGGNQAPMTATTETTQTQRRASDRSARARLDPHAQPPAREERVQRRAEPGAVRPRSIASSRIPSCASAILTGAGGSFSAGMDLKALLKGEQSFTKKRGGFGIMTRPPDKPLIAAIEGYAVAGGLELALCCDLIVAAEDSKLGLPEVKRGLVAVGGALFRLPKRIPYHVVMELALTGDSHPAERFRELGLVNRVVPQGQALERRARAGQDDRAERTALARRDQADPGEVGGMGDRSRGLARAPQDREQGAALEGRERGFARVRREARAGLARRVRRRLRSACRPIPCTARMWPPKPAGLLLEAQNRRREFPEEPKTLPRQASRYPPPPPPLTALARYTNARCMNPRASLLHRNVRLAVVPGAADRPVRLRRRRQRQHQRLGRLDDGQRRSGRQG